MKAFKSFQEFADEVGKDDSLQAQIQSDPAGVIQKVKIKDKWVYRMAIYFLGTIVILIIIGTFIMLIYDKSIPFPEFLISIASTAIGAIAGLISQNT